MIKVVDVWHHYGIRPILKNVSLQVEEGELVAIMGPNGMGKSTLLGLMGGVLSPLKGYIEIDGRKRRQSIEDEIEIRKHLFYLPAEPFLPMYSTGREFLLAMGRLYGVEEQRLMEHADQLLRLFDLQLKSDTQIKSYSTGQLKKITICSALITDAKNLVLDEPFSGGLDPSALIALSRILSYLAKRNDITVVMAIPVPELVEPLAHKVAVLVDGEIMAFDSADGLRKLTNTNGPLNEVLEKLVHTDVLQNVKEYIERRNT